MITSRALTCVWVVPRLCIPPKRRGNRPLSLVSVGKTNTILRTRPCRRDYLDLKCRHSVAGTASQYRNRGKHRMRGVPSIIGLLVFALTASASGQETTPTPKTEPCTRAHSTLETRCRNADSTYVRLSSRQKFGIFLKGTYSPYTFASAAANATWAQMWGQWYQYGGGMQGWGKRLGATLADTEARSFVQTFALSSLLHQDPRYFPAKKRGIIPRSWYAATRVLITKNDHGENTFNSSEMLGTLFVSSLENAYYPRHDRGFDETITRFIGAIGSDATSNLLREFWPDIKRIFRKHEPQRIKRIEEKFPHAKKPACRLPRLPAPCNHGS
jgi:hypothetical protein